MPLERVSKGFRDLSMSFQTNPLNNDLIGLKNETAIARSIRNIVYTYPGEKIFNPYFGSRISRSLFENLDGSSVDVIKSEITSSINRFEPRVQLSSVNVIPDYDNNGFSVTINYFIIGLQRVPKTLEFILQSGR